MTLRVRSSPQSRCLEGYPLSMDQVIEMIDSGSAGAEDPSVDFTGVQSIAPVRSNDSTET